MDPVPLPSYLSDARLSSAAIYGVRGKADISIFMLFPKGRVSAIQEAQMTSILDSNVHCLSVDGTFDDCQVGFIIPSHMVLDGEGRCGRSARALRLFNLTLTPVTLPL
jgi:hypothetical protein